MSDHSMPVGPGRFRQGVCSCDRAGVLIAGVHLCAVCDAPPKERPAWADRIGRR